MNELTQVCVFLWHKVGELMRVVCCDIKYYLFVIKLICDMKMIYFKPLNRNEVL